MKRDPKTTSRIMSSIRNKNTKPELLVRKALWKKGYRYRVNYKVCGFRPDVVLTKAKIAIFCDGDFWHGNNWRIRGLSSFDEELSKYSPYWKDKIICNVARDKSQTSLLRENGWLVIRIWESDIKSNLDQCVKMIETAYAKRFEN